jgi:hypothetical protein
MEDIGTEKARAAAVEVMEVENDDLESEFADAQQQNAKQLEKIDGLEKKSVRHSTDLDFLMVALQLPLLSQD